MNYNLVWFYGISTIVGYLMPNPFLYIYLIYCIWFGLVLWHINHCRLFNAKSFLYIYLIYCIWFGLVLWHINHCRLFNAKSSLYIYIRLGHPRVGELHPLYSTRPHCLVQAIFWHTCSDLDLGP